MHTAASASTRGGNLHIVCPGCNAKNRLPAGRISEKPKCGSCRSPLFNAHPITLTTANFQTHIGNSDIPVLVDFWAPWCGPCRMMAPAFEAAAPILEPQFRLCKVNTEAEPALGAQYKVRSIPTMILFQAGREVGRQPGAIMVPAQIAAWARSQV